MTYFDHLAVLLEWLWVALQFLWSPVAVALYGVAIIGLSLITIFVAALPAARHELELSRKECAMWIACSVVATILASPLVGWAVSRPSPVDWAA